MSEQLKMCLFTEYKGEARKLENYNDVLLPACFCSRIYFGIEWFNNTNVAILGCDNLLYRLVHLR